MTTKTAGGSFTVQAGEICPIRQCQRTDRHTHSRFDDLGWDRTSRSWDPSGQPWIGSAASNHTDDERIDP